MSETISIEKAVEIALEQHQAGNLARAESLYVQILRQDPGNIDAMHLLGVLAFQGRRPDVAIELIGRAISRRGDVPIFHYNLAEAFVAVGRQDDAVAAYERAVELDPAYIAAHNNLSAAANTAQQYQRAEAAARRALELSPDLPEAYNNLGTALRGLRRTEEAESAYARAVELKPDFAEAITNHAMCLCAMARLDDGIAQFRRAIQLRPALPDVHNNLGTALTYRQRFDEAAEAFQTALDLNPQHAEANNNLGSSLRSMGKLVESLRFFEKAIEIKPDFSQAHANRAAALADLNRKAEALKALEQAMELHPPTAKMHFFHGILLRDQRRPDEGIVAIRKALELEPTDSGTLTSLGYALLEQGELDEALDALQRSVGHAPDPQSHSNFLMTANYHPAFTPRELFDLHRRWAELNEKPLTPAQTIYLNDRSSDRKLRIGYVSPDFRGHSVAYFLEPILANHDLNQFEIYGYAQVVNVDNFTYRLRAQINHWRETASKSLEEIDAMIRKDQIDILIDLAGHTGGNLLPVFTKKPAPVQINMIGFPSTTGLSAMDYRITDARCDPPGQSDATNSESLIRMPSVFWVYQPPSRVQEIGELPAITNGYVTFTSVNNFTKVTPQMQTTWARLLRAVPKSRLIIQTMAITSQILQTAVKARFAAEGVSEDRLEFRPWSDLTEYFGLLERSDLTLDPYPFNGGTTTCHSLWMGAPVITLAGDRHASRMGLSMMTAIGLPQFVAHTPEQYVETGVRAAGDVEQLRAIRAGMRERLLQSPLLDGAGYTRELERVYRQAWQRWCHAV